MHASFRPDSRHPASSPSSSPSKAKNESYCCRGYCIDLLRLLKNESDFTFSLYLSFDDEYGALERNNKSGKEARPTLMHFESVHSVWFY